jgi:hypothetical protein
VIEGSRAPFRALRVKKRSVLCARLIDTVDRLLSLDRVARSCR